MYWPKSINLFMFMLDEYRLKPLLIFWVCDYETFYLKNLIEIWDAE